MAEREAKMTQLIINARDIKEVRDGRNSNYGYDYKEYIYNENYTEAYSIRIPIGTHGIKAIQMSNGQGIKDEYGRVYLDNGGKITKLFNVNEPDEKDIQIQILLKEIEILKTEKAVLQEMLYKVRSIVEVY
jgi:hypothetical protein